jgi:predicted outer membrane protein
MPADDDDLRDSHRDAMRSLAERAKGREFDEAFVEHEVHMHRKALDRVKDVLEDNKSPELRTLLEQARAGLEAHLKTAEELEKKFGAA